MRFALALILLAVAACGSSAGAPPAVGTPLTEPQLKFAVMDAVGKPSYCDQDFFPVARQGGEQASAISMYPQIKADAVVYAAIIAHEKLPSGDLTDDQKVVVYRAWKLLNTLTLTETWSGQQFAFQFRVQSGGGYQMVAGTVRVDGVVKVSSQTATGPPVCPICLAQSTVIATPSGPAPVTDVRIGMLVWSESATGERVAEPVIKVGSIEAPAGHLMVHLALADGRQLLVSPGHKTADGRPAGTLKAGDSLDGSSITVLELVPYRGERTYDLLPAGATGHYWADGILLSSTLN